jgi:Glycosyltransferase family 9 (heptosyltransferase)
MMGIGDDIMATGLARGLADKGQRAAFGDGKRLIWGPFSEEAFRHNPNIARAVTDPGLVWIDYHKGNRWYNKAGNGRWIWNYEFAPTPGEFYFDNIEKQFAMVRTNSVLLEPNVPWHKSVAPNKDWGHEKWQALADKLIADRLLVCQTSYGKKRLERVHVVPISTFRSMAAALSGFDVVVTPEGGMHHAAAAVGTPAVVLFGGFIPPQVTGYPFHSNLTGGATACGSWRECPHCRAAMAAISVEEVYERTIKEISGKGSTASARANRIRGLRAATSAEIIP